MLSNQSASAPLPVTGLEAELRDLLRIYGVDTDWTVCRTDEVLERIAVDKKRARGEMRFVLAAEGGAEEIEISQDELAKILGG